MAGAERLGANLEVDGGIVANETGQNDLIHISVSIYSYTCILREGQLAMRKGGGVRREPPLTSKSSPAPYPITTGHAG